MTKKTWILISVGIAVVSSFLLSESFRHTLSRKKSLREAEKQIASLTDEINRVKTDLSRLDKEPASYETLVRRELGYLRPGEKEIKFLNRKGS